jgi:hypothetical protein
VERATPCRQMRHPLLGLINTSPWQQWRHATIAELFEAVFSMWSVPRLYNEVQRHLGIARERNPCGGGVEYFHRDPASRKRRRNGKSQIWDSKIWSRVPRDSDARKTAVGRPTSIYKRQTRPLVREGATQKQDRNCQIVIAKYLVMSPRWGSNPRLSDWLTVSRNVTLTLTWYSRPLCSWVIWIREPGPPGSGSLESQAVKYGHESRGTRTREWLCWRGQQEL